MNDLLATSQSIQTTTGLVGAIIVSTVATLAYVRRFLSKDRVGRASDDAQVSVFKTLQMSLAEEIARRQEYQKQAEDAQQKYVQAVLEIGTLKGNLSALQGRCDLQLEQLSEREILIDKMKATLALRATRAAPAPVVASLPVPIKTREKRRSATASTQGDDT